MRSVANEAEHKEEVRWNLVFQYSGIAALLVQGVVLVPVYLRFVGSAEFGIWLFATSVSAWLAAIDPGVSALMQMRVSRTLGAADAFQAVRLARDGLRIGVIAALTILIIGLFASHAIWVAVDSKRVLTAEAGWWLGFLSVAGVAFGIVANCLTALGIAFRAARAHTVVWLGSVAGGVALTLAGLEAGWGVAVLPAGVVARWLLQSTGSLWLLRKKLSGASHEAAVAPHSIGALRGPILGWAAVEKLAGTLMLSADLFLVGWQFGGAMVTAYGLTKRPVDLLASLLVRPAMAMGPTIAYGLGEASNAQTNAKITQLCLRMFWLLGAAVLGVVLWLKTLVGLWVGSGQYMGDQVCWLLAGTLGVTVCGGLFSNLFWASGAAVQFYATNLVASLLTMAGMVVGAGLNEVRGMLVGALVPQAFFALVIFRRLALQALQIDRMSRAAIRQEAFRSGIVMAACMGAATSCDTWWSWPGWATGSVFSIMYWLLLTSISPRLRRELTGWVGLPSKWRPVEQ
jgi:hypothetical protein